MRPFLHIGAIAGALALDVAQASPPPSPGPSGIPSLHEIASPVRLPPLSSGPWSPSSGSVPGDELWWDGFALPVVDGFVFCATVYEDRVVIGGRFTQVGGIRADNIAQWDGVRWSALGSGTNDVVVCLLVHEGDLIAGGRFERAGDVSAAGIARWDGSRWSSLGPGLLDTALQPAGVLGLGSYRGQLIATGDFTRSGNEVVRYVAAWNGEAWTPLGEGLNGVGLSIAVFEDALYVGGYFDSAGTSPAARIGKWDGSRWASVGGGVTGPSPLVQSLAIFQGELIAAGQFDTAGVVPARNIAAWNGSEWQALGSGLDNAIFAAASHDGLLFVGGAFDGNALTVWDGSSWSPGPWLPGLAYALVSAGDDLIVGGLVQAYRSGGTAIAGFHVVRWTGEEWLGMESWTDRMHGLVGWGGNRVEVFSLASYRGELVAAGWFEYAGDPPDWSGVSTIARWDGGRWQRLPSSPPGRVTELLTSSDGLYVGGPLAGNVPVVRFDGAKWTYLDTLSLSVTSMVQYQNRLWIGGTRTSLSGPRIGGVYQWDGADWRLLGPLEDASDFPGIHAMVESNGHLVVGGTFTSIGGVAASNIAAWDGSRWHALGEGLANDHGVNVVYALAHHEGKLIAAGQFDQPRASVVAWDGSTWQPLGGRIGLPLSLASVNGKLFAGGSLRGSGFTLTGVLCWDGHAWQPLGSGTNDAVRDFLAQDDHLFLSGRFTQAGGRSSFGVARWDGLADPGTVPPLSFGAAVPNPFAASTTLTFRLLDAGPVRLSVLDVQGREVAVLARGYRPAGPHTIVWDGRDDHGRDLGAGLYFVRLQLANGDDRVRRLVRIR